jgi:hypothetical protein
MGRPKKTKQELDEITEAKKANVVKKPVTADDKVKVGFLTFNKVK